MPTPIGIGEPAHDLHRQLLSIEYTSAPTDPTEMAAVMAQYYGMVSEVDARLGRVFDHLRASGKAAVSILIDHETLINGAHPDTICEHSNGSLIPVDVAREIACTAALIPILRDRWGVVLDLGRERRSTSIAQRRAIEAMYATCFMTSCEVSVTDCHIHHIDHWKNGGRTDLDNLAPICKQHHNLIHNTRAKMTIDAQRTITVTPVIGTTTYHTPDRQPHRCRRTPESGEEDPSVRSEA
jgi:hypothetical protein